MKIFIHPTALQSENPSLLAPESLSSMKKLQEAEYDLFTELNTLNQEVINLLINERIELKDGSSTETETQIIPDTKKGMSLMLENDSGVIAEGKNWSDLVKRILYPVRISEITRSTHETKIDLSILLDGKGESEINTGLNFFDHMLDQIARHGLIDLKLKVQGDLEVDEHHTIEDTAIVLGTAIRNAISDNKAGIQRYGFMLPMDESQAMVAIDLSDRPYLRWDVNLKREYIGDLPTEMLEHFFYTLAMNARATIHVKADGKNEHHIVESIFKGFAKALRFAISRNERMKGILPSTKGMI